jgi:hypothetical protein
MYHLPNHESDRLSHRLVVRVGPGGGAAAAPRVPQVSIIRRALKLSQEDFAAAFHIPIGTLRDWEQRRKEPDAAARAYLRVIAREPETVRKALAELRDARRRSRRYQPDAA